MKLSCKRFLSGAVSLIVATLAFAFPARADELFVQLPTWDNIQAFNYTNSMRNSATGNYGWITMDDFFLDTAAILDGVSFQGTYFDWQDPGNNPPPSNSLGFEFHFWEDDGNSMPGNYLGFDYVDISNMSVTFNSNWDNELDIYDFHADLNAPFQIDANQQYWISVVSSSLLPEDNGVPAFGWMSGLATDGVTVTPDGTLQEWVPSGARSTWTSDRSLTLHGQAIPEPSSVLLIVGTALVFCSRRRI